MNIPNYQQLLTAAIEKLSKKHLQELILSVCERDIQLNFQLTAQLVPMSIDETVVLLNHAIDCTMQGRRKVDPDAQELIGKITDALLTRANSLLEKKDIISAAGIAFSIIVAVEPKMTEVSDEGFTFQQVITEAIQFLADLPNHSSNRQQFAVLSLSAYAMFSSIPEEARMYDYDWRRIIELFRQHSLVEV